MTAVSPPGSARADLGAMFAAAGRAIVETQQSLDLAAFQPPALLPDTTDILPPLAFVVGAAGLEFTGRLSLGAQRRAGDVPTLEFALASRVDQTLGTAVATRLSVSIRAVRPVVPVGDERNG